MVMMQRSRHMVCLMDETPREKLAELAATLEFEIR
jgi:hypothetical protein